jgi:hypothetical protein
MKGKAATKQCNISSFLSLELALVQISLLTTGPEDSEINHDSSAVFILDIAHLFASAAGNKRTAVDVTYGTNSFLDTLTLQD